MKGYFQSPVCTFYRDLTLTTDHSIARYIARLHPALGLYGRNPLQASEVRINCCLASSVGRLPVHSCWAGAAGSNSVVANKGCWSGKNYSAIFKLASNISRITCTALNTVVAVRRACSRPSAAENLMLHIEWLLRNRNLRAFLTLISNIRDSKTLTWHEFSTNSVFVIQIYQTAMVDYISGLKITAGQRTMSGLIVDLTGQTLVWPVILTGHLWIQTFYNIFHKLSLNAFCSVYNAVVTSFLFGFFSFAASH